eukprot:m.923061 g.923061  ORF g.923061 m.923061 type:complete len:979 (+) comp23764_c0_seq4:706-3642(+)
MHRSSSGGQSDATPSCFDAQLPIQMGSVHFDDESERPPPYERVQKDEEPCLGLKLDLEREIAISIISAPCVASTLEALDIAKQNSQAFQGWEFTSILEAGKDKCSSLRRRGLGTQLTDSEIQVIYMYTMQTADGNECSFYTRLNLALRLARGAEDLDGLYPLLKLLVGALQKLPPVTDVFFRGLITTRENFVAYEDAAEHHDTVVWRGVTSTTTNCGQLRDYISVKPEHTEPASASEVLNVGHSVSSTSSHDSQSLCRCVFVIKAVAYDISIFSAEEQEAEHIILPFTTFRVGGIADLHQGEHTPRAEATPYLVQLRQDVNFSTRLFENVFDEPLPPVELTEVEKWISTWMPTPSTMTRRAMQSEEQQPAVAEYFFRRAIREGKNDADPYLGLARIMLKQSQDRDALEILVDGRKQCGADSSEKLASLHLEYAEVLLWRLYPEATSVSERQHMLLEAHKTLDLALDCNSQAKMGSPKPSYADKIKSRTLCALGKAHRKYMNEPELAKRRFTDAIQYDETNATAHFQLGRLYEKVRNDTSMALEEYVMARKYATGSNLAVVCINSGVLLQRKRDYTGALEVYNAAIRADSDRADIYLNLGLLMQYGLNDRIKAKQNFETAINKCASFADAYFHHAMLLEEPPFEKFGMAAEEYRLAIHYNPSDEIARYRLGMLLWKKTVPTDIGGARSSLAEAVRLAMRSKRPNTDAMAALAALLVEDNQSLRDSIKARNLYLQLIELDGKNVPYRLGFAKVIDKDSQRPRTEFVELALSVRSADSAAPSASESALAAPFDALQLSPKATFDAPTDEDAVAAYKGVLDVDKSNVEAHCGLGSVWCRIAAASGHADHKESAVSSFHAALSIDSKYAAAYFGLAMLHTHFKETKKAIRMYRRGFDINDECNRSMNSTWHAFGDLLASSGAAYRADARDVFKKLCQANPDDTEAKRKLDEIPRDSLQRRIRGSIRSRLSKSGIRPSPNQAED